MDSGDLEYNQRGELGPGQRARLEALSAQSNSVGTFGLGYDPAVVRFRAFRTQIRQGLQDGRVIASTGKVDIDLRAFHSGMANGERNDLPGNYESVYRAAFDRGETVKVAHWLDILPGRHELYVAVWAGIVVGASPLPPFDHAHTLFRALLAVQGLDAETLAENRRGRMTGAQQRILRSDDGGSGSIGLFFLGAIVASHAAGRIFGLLSSRRGGNLMTLTEAAVALILIVCGIGVLVHHRRHRAAILLDIEEGRSTTIVGILGKRFVAINRSVSRKIQLGARTFDITDRAELYVTLIPGFVYRAYVAPRSDKLLAIELLPQERTTAVAPF